MKYIKHNFLPGRQFIDIVDLTEQLMDWNATIADTRVHGTTHERPIDRFAAEQPQLILTNGQRSFAQEGRRSRIVASDYLVSLHSNRYSVPFQLIGQTVELQAKEGRLVIWHRGRCVAEHPLLTGQHQLRILPEHGPGAIARNTRQRFALAGTSAVVADIGEVQVRELTLYEQLAAHAAPEVTP